MPDLLLLETGGTDNLLLEDTEDLLLESSVVIPITTDAPFFDGEELFGQDYRLPLHTTAPFLDSGAVFAPGVVLGTPSGLEVRHGSTVLEGFARSWRDPLGEVGSWSLSMENADPDVPDFVDIVSFRLDGQIRFAGPVIGKNVTTHGPAETVEQVTVLSGLGRLAVTDKSVIEPSRGWDAEPVETTRTQSYVAVDYDDTSWPYAKRIRRADTPTPYYPRRSMPEWWPDKSAWWVAPNRSDITGDDAPVGIWPIRSDPITLGAGTHEILIGLNNLGQVYFDGALIAHLANAPVDGNRIRLDVSAGDHVIAARVGNFIRDTGFIGSIWTVDDDGLLDTLEWSSDSDNMRALPYPPTAPGMTAGRAIRDLVEEIQAEGELTDLDLDFTDLLDTDGEPWSRAVEITVDVGRSLMEYLEALSDWLVDVQMAPGANVLRAWNWGTRGGTPGVTIAATSNPASSEVQGLSFDGRHIRANRLRIRYRRGYTEVDQSGADPTVTAFIDLNQVTSEDAAQTIGENLLALRKDPSYAGTLTLASVGSEPYGDFGNGDTVTHPADPDGTTSSRVRSIAYTEDDNAEPTWMVELHDITQGVEERHENWLRRSAMGTLAGGARVVSKSGDPIDPDQKLSSKNVAEFSFDNTELVASRSPTRPADSSGNLIEIWAELTTAGSTTTTVRAFKNGVQIGSDLTFAAGVTETEVDLSAGKCYRNVDKFHVEIVTAGTGAEGLDVQIRAI